MTNSRTARSTREKAAELRAAAQRKEARRRTTLVSSAVALVLVLVVAAVVVVKVAQNSAAAAAAPPTNVVDNGIVVGQSTAPVTVTVYEDFQCPACKQFEDTNSAQLAQWVAAGTVKVVYKPVAILDRYSSTAYSTRAMNAAGAVVATAPSAFVAFHSLLFANQPAENSSGLTDATLLDYAVKAGAARSAVEPAITSQTYQGWTVSATDAFSQAGYDGTPTVLVNGTQVKDWSAASFAATVEAAAKK